MNPQSQSTSQQKRSKNPVENANFLSKFTFWWIKDLFKTGLKGPLQEHDIYETLKQHESEKLSNEFETEWAKQIESGDPKLFRVMMNVYGKKILRFGFMYSCIDSLARILQPQCLGGLVSYFSPQQKDITKSEAYYYAIGIILCSLIPVIVFHPFILYIFQIGMKIRVACCSLLYKKALRITKSASVDGMTGQVINLMSNDVAKFDVAVGYIHDLWKAPIETVILLILIYREIGWSGVQAIVCLLPVFFVLQGWIGKKAASFRLKTAERTDGRVRFMNEIIQGIQVIKMYAWENSFAKIVDQIRRKEIKVIRGTLFLRAGMLSFNLISRLGLFLALISYMEDGQITASKVFIVTSYFNSIYSSMLQFWPLAIFAATEGLMSVLRVQNFLLIHEKPIKKRDAFVAAVEDEELQMINKNTNNLNENGLPAVIDDGKEDKNIINNKLDVEKGIYLKNCTVDWGLDEENSIRGLSSVSLQVKEGELCAVIGPVGSGKSTLLQVILNELPVNDKSVTVNGVLSYAPQEPWLFEGSIRDNIVFIEEFDAERYEKVVEVCALKRDFELFPNGDETIVGERGVSLSGGQRARISLARAMYKKADIYLLDDPLSAVDTHVGRYIFDKCILDYLKDKVCVLVTHQLQYLKDVEHVVLMNAGAVVAQDSYSNLEAAESFLLLNLSRGGDDGGEEKDGEDDNDVINGEDESFITHKGNIFDTDSCLDKDSKMGYENKENQAVGSVGFQVYHDYLKAVESGLLVGLVASLFILSQSAMSGIDYLISQWVNNEESKVVAKDENDETMTRAQFIIIYATTILLALVFSLSRSFSFFQMCLRSSIRLHDKLFNGVTRATMYFFNTNPSGRILNRFSKDIGCIDTNLPIALMDCVIFFLEFTAIVILVAVVNFWLLFPTLVMAVLFYGLRHVYVNTARSVKRLEAMTRSPIFSHANASFQGLTTIRAFGAQKIVAHEFDRHQDLNTSAWYLFLASTRAFAFWLELVCVLYIAVVTMSFLVIANDEKSGNVGLAITQVFNLIFMCQWGMRQTAELENQMTSVERVIEYTELKPEPPLQNESSKAPEEWPRDGRIVFKNFNLKYSEDSEPVLKNMSMEIAPKEKIGVVGRTGAGKSSIIQALFRLAVNEGTIEIDDLDIGTLGLHELRKKISIIPQEPILFSGTIRDNLDPFREKSDDDIWDSLKHVELKEFVSSFEGGLDYQMGDEGSNFSMGQRQLVCLARAILKNNKILILDEATANVDPQTDNLIQKTIRNRFESCTVITIAHRLHTIMDNDRVLVMDSGKIIEFDHPYNLLQDENGLFRKLVDKTGQQTAQNLTKLAEDSFRA